MFLPCLFPSLSSPNLIILRVSEYITLLKILLIYYIKFFNFGVAFSGLLSLIKILNINFGYFTMDKNIKDYITGMYNFFYDGYWWDKYDTDTRMQVLCELTDIYKEKLVRRSGPGEDKLSE
jgi:hypothetical protein